METTEIDDGGGDQNNPKRKAELTPKESLELLYHGLDGPNWKKQENWLSADHDVSQWSGVTCNAQGEITALELSQNNLKGVLTTEIVETLPSSIEQLWLSENQLSGNLPAALAHCLPKLSILDVGSNQLQGALHPALAQKATQLSWFDITGNQLTSYFRYDKEAAEEVEAVVPRTMGPKPHFHVKNSLIKAEACKELIQLAVDYTSQESNQWQTGRHKEYQTTDLDVAVVGGTLLERCNHHLQHSILPALQQLFDVPLSDMAVEDLFLAKYSADGQRSLPAHRDGSELSFVLTLNQDFEGGGTQFFIGSHSAVAAPANAGAGTLFCGRLRHAGVEITKGTRYILAGFVRVYPSTPKAQAKLQEILDHANKATAEKQRAP